jgi:hypothetical protein
LAKGGLHWPERRLVLPVAIQRWSLTSLQQRLFKTGGRHLTGILFRQILARIERLAEHPTDDASESGHREADHRRQPCLRGAQ